MVQHEFSINLVRIYVAVSVDTSITDFIVEMESLLLQWFLYLSIYVSVSDSLTCE